MNAADLLCMQECRQTRDRTNGHLVDSNTLLIELNSPSVKSVVYVKADLRLIIWHLIQSFDKCLL